MARRLERMPKLTLPDTSSAVPLPRLAAVFDEALTRPVVWISAPGGSGKTTLVAHQLSASTNPIVWLQLDEDDADPGTFFHFLVRAIKARFPRRKLSVAPFTHEYALGVRAYVRAFLRVLTEVLPDGTVIVVDNAQFADRESFFAALLGEFANATPASLRLVVASRHVPPERSAQLVVRSQLASIRWEQLQLRAGEMRAIATARGKSVPDATLMRLGGWVAGVVLVAQAPQVEPPERGDAETQELAFAYFAAEIFDAESTDTQRFLAANSLWPRFTAASARRLTSNAGAAAIVRRLVRENFFTTRHGSRTGAYTFHPLFRRFLQERARCLFAPDELARLTLHAASLLEEDGDLEQALELRVAGADWPEVARLANQYGPELLYRGRHRRMLRWLELTPPDTLTVHPELALWRGLARVITDPRAGFADIDVALDGFERAGDVFGLFTALVALLESRVLLFDFRDLEPRVEQLLRVRASLALLQSERMDMMAGPGVLGALSVVAPKHPEVEGWAERLERLVAGEQPLHRRLMSGAILMFYYTHRGMTAAANQLRGRLAPLARNANQIPYALISWEMMSGANRYWFSDDVSGLGDVAEQCWTLSRDTGIHTTDHFITDCGCLAAFAHSDLTAAQAQVRRLEQSGVPAGAYHRIHYFLNLAWYAWLRGNSTHAAELLVAAEEAARADPTPLAVAYIALASAQVWLDLGDVRRALGQLARARQLGKRHGYSALLAMVHYVGAEIALARRQPARARPLLRAALQSAASLGLHRTLFFAPCRFAKLLAFALRHQLEPGFARQLIHALDLEPADIVTDPAEWTFDVEVYVLGEFRLVRDGQSVGFGRKAPRRALQLLHAIIAAGGRNVAFSRLTLLLWPDLDGDAATRALRTALYRLRKIVGEGALETSEDGVSINQRSCWVDALAFEQLTRGGHPGGPLDRPESRAREALTLYKGHFLADVDTSWAVELRERLWMRATRIVEQIARQHLGDRQWNEAMSWYQYAVDIDPTAEGFYQGIMRAQLAAGQYGDAVNTFRTLSRVLTQALNTQPSSVSRALYVEATSAAVL
ncbi:MAG: BTAD domain-containing putative transcriptional regulator [Pseudomonadota bacterium]